MNQLAAHPSANNTLLFNEAVIKVPGMFGATLLPYTQSVYTTGCLGDFGPQPWDMCAADATEVTFKIGTYVSPEMSTSAGTNHQNFSVVMDTNATVAMMWTLGFLSNTSKMRLILKAEGLSVKAMGMTFKDLS